jgi:phospholipid N-methyltransferase
MVRPLPLKRARIVVEVGPGTGVMTRALLDVIPFEATLLAFEINPRFSRYLKSNVPATLYNLKLDTDSWAQASLPVRRGGILARIVVALAPSFISSMQASGSTVQTVLPAEPSRSSPR